MIFVCVCHVFAIFHLASVRLVIIYSAPAFGYTCLAVGTSALAAGPGRGIADGMVHDCPLL